MEIGTIKYLRRYPVKSMRGEDLERAFLDQFGFKGDRMYAFVDNNNEDKKFPWMTARQAHEMLLFKPRFVSDSLDRVEIETPEGDQKFLVGSDEFETYLEGRFKYDLSLKYDMRGCFDSRPISLFGIQTIERLEGETSLSLDYRRFRANIYADWNNKTPFFEDQLLGRRLALGNQAIIKVVKKDSRCVIPTLDPTTSHSEPLVLKMIQDKHGGCAGVYAEVERTGSIALGDPIALQMT
jgi:uncharacterized protein